MLLEGTMGELGEPVTFAPWAPPEVVETSGKGRLCVEAINCTCFSTAFSFLMTREAVMVISEHAMHAAVHEAWRKKASAHGFQVHLGPADPEASAGRARAGVGFLAPAQYCMTVM